MSQPITEQTFAELKSASEDVRHVRKSLAAVIWLAPEDADPITGLTTADGLKVQSFPTTYQPVGLLTPDGPSFTREVSMSDVEAHGHFSPVRRDPESGTEEFTFTAYEILRKRVAELRDAVDLSAVTPDTTSGEVVYEVPSLPVMRYYRAILATFDGTPDKPWLEGVFYPRVQVTSFPGDQWSKSDARSAEIGFTAYDDPELHFVKRRFYGGAGFKAQSAALGWTAPAGG